jgi:hypothetical protein
LDEFLIAHGDEIVVSSQGWTSCFLSQEARQPESRSRAKLGKAYCHVEISEFRAHAFQAAVSKARELGWIV